MNLEYQREVLQMEAEFAPAQWEALKLEINRSPHQLCGGVKKLTTQSPR